MQRCRVYLVMMTLLVLMVSCTMPETRIYSLSVQTSIEPVDVRADKAISIIVHAPRYLSQPYIAHRLSPYQLEVSRYAKWESAPGDIVKETLRESLSSILKDVHGSAVTARDTYSLVVNLKRFEKVGSAGPFFGELVMDFSLLSPEGKELCYSSISKNIKLEEQSNIALAKGLSIALTEAVKEIKASIIPHIVQAS